MDWFRLLLAAVATAAVPLLWAVFAGVDRRLTARAQDRVGPPLLQPLYDVVKLMSKSRLVVNGSQLVMAGLFASMAVLSTFLILAGADLLLLFFVLSATAAFYAMAGFAVLSPYSRVGATRELYQVMAYEPVLLVVFLCFFVVNGSFDSGPFESSLLGRMPLAFAAMALILLVKLQKSPFDVAEAHTEIVSGPEVEYSGPTLGTVTLGRWYEDFTYFAVLSMFWGHPDPLVSLAGKVALVLGTLVVLVLVDNSTARLRYRQLPGLLLAAGLALAAVNAASVWLVERGWTPW